MNFHAPASNNRPLELPLMFGHFVPWYTIHGSDFPAHPDDAATIAHLPPIEDMRHWNDPRAGYLRTHHHTPTIGVYDSRSPAVITWQIETALEFGLTGFSINWYGRNSVENVITLHWLRGLRDWNVQNPDRPFHYFLSFDSQAHQAGEGRIPCTMQEDFQYIKDHLVNDAYLHRDGRPVFSTFAYQDNCAEGRAAMDAVFGPGGADLIWMNHPRNAGENACFAWVRPDDEVLDDSSIYPWKDPNNPGDGFLRKFYRAPNTAEKGVEYLMAGVWPGFNDELVAWAWKPDPNDPRIRPRVIVRESRRGNTLGLTWQAYIDYLRDWVAGSNEARIPAPLIQLVTWNDYAETTTVEPTRDYGTAPLDLCRQRIKEARNLWRQRLLS
ncbi:MAG: hypothetical protein V1929_07030 [bacterium]